MNDDVTRPEWMTMPVEQMADRLARYERALREIAELAETSDDPRQYVKGLDWVTVAAIAVTAIDIARRAREGKE